MPKISDSNYEIKNDRIQKALRYISRFIQDCLPDGWGFTVLLFDFNNIKGGSLFYISNGNREDVINTMKEFIQKEETKTNFDT